MGTIIRKQNWPILLDNYFIKRIDTPFRHGRHDCCISAIRAVHSFTGVNLHEGIKKYKNEKEAEELKKKYGGILGIAEAAAKIHELEEINPKKASGGDIVVLAQEIDGKIFHSLGTVSLDGRFVYGARSPKGWSKSPASNIIKAWKI